MGLRPIIYQAIMGLWAHNVLLLLGAEAPNNVGK